MYIGMFEFNGNLFDAGDNVPSIIDFETWDKAQTILGRNAEPTGEVDKLGRKITKGRGRRTAGRHLFSKSMPLRCSCGESMYPVTQASRTPGTPYEVYKCMGRKVHGIDSCPQMPVKRELIDGAVWEFVQRVALDVDSTRTAIEHAHSAKLAEIDALRADADREVAKVERAVATIEHDYLMTGKLSAARYEALSAKLEEQHGAAQAQVAQLDAQRQALVAELAQLDVESELLRSLAAIRNQIIGEAREGAEGGTDALGATLRRLFSHFQLVPNGKWPVIPDGIPEGIVWPQDDTAGPEVDGYWLIPFVRPEAFDMERFEPSKVALDGIRDFHANGLER